MTTKNIQIQGLNKSYGNKQVLNNINLIIEPGMFGLLGRNGAGKTTLMKVLTTLLTKDSGSITVCGIPIENAKDIRRITGYLPQEFSMHPNMTVRESLDYLGVLSNIPKDLRKERINVLLTTVNLILDSRKKIRQLSGGMKRRLGIAQALLHDPKILIVDEPTAGLDPEERIRFRNLLCEIAKDRIVLLSTHIIGDIEATCNQVAILDRGTLLYNGSTTDLLKTVRGKVYNTSVLSTDVSFMKQQYIVTATLPNGSETKVHFISDSAPVDEAIPCDPSVEDAYMLCLHKNGLEVHELGGVQ